VGRCHLNQTLGPPVFKEGDNSQVVKKVEANGSVPGHGRALDVEVVQLNLIETKNVLIQQLESTMVGTRLLGCKKNEKGENVISRSSFVTTKKETW